MRGMLTRVAVLAVVAAGCSASGTPATVPSSIPVTMSVATTAAVLPTTTTSFTTTTKATTTTVDRRSEIEAIFQDLEERRLQALYDGDREAFKALFANDEYLERSMGAFDVVTFEGPPTVRVEILEILAVQPTCIAARRVLNRLDLDQVSDASVGVLEMTAGEWGFSYTGEGWTCAGPHPLSP
jgi:hypothetical protein